MDSFGRPIVRQEADIESKIAYLRAIEKDIRDYLNSPNEDGGIDFKKKYFPVIHISGYCQDNLINPTSVVPAEYAMGYFSLDHGMNDIDDTIHGFVNPVETPIGLLADAMEQSKILKVPMINQHKEYRLKETTPEEFLIKLDSLFFQKRPNPSCISKFMDVKLAVIDRPGCRYIFAARKECIIVDRAIRWCQQHIVRNDKNTHLFMRYTVIPLATVLRIFSEFANLKNPSINVLPTDADAGTILDHHKFMYLDGLSCKWHNRPENENQELCSFNIVRRMMYNLFKYLSKLYFKMKVPSHAPFVAIDEDSDRYRVVIPCNVPIPENVKEYKSDSTRQRRYN